MSQPREGYSILGVDPGATTGVFEYSPHRTHCDWMPYQVPAADMPLFLDRTFRRLTKGGRKVYVAVEKYIITQRTARLSQQADALEVTGEVKAVGTLHGVTDVRQYLKSNLKYADDAMLKAVNWWTYDYPHANDAARQAFALLKDVDYPLWSKIVADARLDSEDEGRKMK
jgi:hypothetical protein